MMKFTVVLLLLLNVAYFMWMQMGGGVRSSASAPEELADVSASQFVAADVSLMLVSERPAAPVAVPLPVTMPEPEVLVSPPLAWCAIATGFEDAAGAERFAGEVNSLGGAAELQSERVPVSSTWWVHLAPFPDESAAAETLAELKARQIDSYYIRSGELTGAISLGVFRSAERAAVAQQELAAKGYTALVREVIRFEVRSSVSLTLRDEGMRQGDEWARLQASFSAVKLQEIACK